MDGGTWIFRCQNCGDTFEIEAKTSEQVIEHAKLAPCPHCNIKPVENEIRWHHVIGFRNINTD